MAMITEIEDYFTLGCGRCDRFATPDCSTRLWIRGLNDLRAIARDVGLSEHVKWGHPCYMHAGRNIALFGAFRTDYRLTFMNAALMADPEGLLERQGPNTQTPDCIRFTDPGQVAAMAPTIRAYLLEAMGYAEQGLKPARVVTEREWPDELVAALDDDPELAEAFHRLTPGRQNSYVVELAGAKTSATRTARILRKRDKIIAGKGASEY
jgi:uncharacterized protein YdeI (YjbR/CyaY-like superfamily)